MCAARHLQVRGPCAAAARFSALLSGVFLLGCAHVESTQRAAQPAAATPVVLAKPLPKRPPPDEPDSIESFMAAHGMLTTWARDAVITGDIAQLRLLMGGLAAYRYDSVKLGGWLPFMQELQQTASLTAEATSVELAATGVATLGRICGECHRATGGGPTEHIAPPKVDTASAPFTQRMQTHVWAADQLWSGLITPSDAAWNAGAKALSSISTQTDNDVPKSYRKPLLDVRALGARADGVTSLAGRADLYGVLLATCGACHQETFEHEM
jgi:mono/diheme cytochrome c family protein